MSKLEQWREALDELKVVHPDRRCTPILNLVPNPLRLEVSLDRAWSTRTGEFLRSPFKISTVYLTFFPGKKLAQQWFAAAWAGYLQHEALEYTSAGSANPLDPHTEPYDTNPFNRGLRDGFPVELTVATLHKALETVMSRIQAINVMVQGGLEPELIS